MVLSDVMKDPGERTDTQRVVFGNCNVMLSTLRGRQAYVTSSLTRGSITEDLEGLGEVVP